MRSKKLYVTAHPRIPSGGDIRGCLSATELDKAVGDNLALAADTFWRYAQGQIGKDAIRTAVRRAIDRFKRAFLIVHVRHHWVVAVCSDHSFKIYDSAPSLMVHRDIMKLAAQLQWPQPVFPPMPRQRRGSNECGLFAAAVILLLARGQSVPTDTGVVSLEDGRSCFLRREKFVQVVMASPTRRKTSRSEAGATILTRWPGLQQQRKGSQTQRISGRHKRPATHIVLMFLVYMRLPLTPQQAQTREASFKVIFNK